MKTQRIPYLFPILALACGEEAPTEPNQPSPADGLVQSIDEGGGVTAVQVDASDTELWVHFDLEAGREVEAEDATWDLAFRRSNIRINGGSSGQGAVEVAPMVDIDFADVQQAPFVQYRVDEPEEAASGEDGGRPGFIDDDATDFAIGRANDATNNGWYNYDPVNHVLSPAPVVFAVRSNEGAFFKVRFLDYYSNSGRAGFPTFRYASISSPDDAAGQVSVDASSREAFTYVRLEDGAIVQPSTAETSLEWDIAFRRTLIRTNGGQSGPGLGQARELAADEVSPIDTKGFVDDGLVPPPGPPTPMEQWTPANDVLSNWFNYDPATRAVSPRDTAFVVRSVDGTPYQVRITAWEDGRFELDKRKVTEQAVVRNAEVSAPGDWTYFSLRLGEQVEVDDPSTSLEWDVAVRGNELRTNGGDSGPGMGGALATGETDLLDIVTVPSEGYLVDEGGLSPVMEQMAQPTEVIAVRLANGTYGKLAFDESDSGFAFAFAGPATRSFR